MLLLTQAATWQEGVAAGSQLGRPSSARSGRGWRVSGTTVSAARPASCAPFCAFVSLTVTVRGRGRCPHAPSVLGCSRHVS